jgi:hypothetical protein
MEDKRVNSIEESFKEYPRYDKKDVKYINKKMYKQIMYLFMKKLIYKLIKTGNLIKLPNKLGSLKIYRYNAKALRKHVESLGKSYYGVDYYNTKKLKEQGIDKTVMLTNKCTNGYWWKLKWSKASHANFKHKSMYSLRLSRPNVRPNSYNKNNPELSIIPYFREIGWRIYSELPLIKSKYINNDKSKNDTA